MKLLLIAGHGAGDPGATSTINGKTYREDNETRRVVSALQQRLGCITYPTDRNAYIDYTHGTLRAVAQFQQYDFALEIHFNAFQAGAADGRIKGVEAYVPTSSDKAIANKLCKAVSACGLTNRGVKESGSLAVINTAKTCGVPACLLEICFLDDPDDMAVYNAKFFAIVQAISDVFGAQSPADDTEAARAWCMAQGISDGSSPDRAVTRSEVWRMLYRMWK